MPVLVGQVEFVEWDPGWTPEARAVGGAEGGQGRADGQLGGNWRGPWMGADRDSCLLARSQNAVRLSQHALSFIEQLDIFESFFKGTPANLPELIAWPSLL
jgi:hypothetical protein